MDALVERLDARLREWRPETAAQYENASQRLLNSPIKKFWI